MWDFIYVWDLQDLLFVKLFVFSYNEENSMISWDTELLWMKIKKLSL